MAAVAAHDATPVASPPGGVKDARLGYVQVSQQEVWLMGYRAQEVRGIGKTYSIVYDRPITPGHPDFLKTDQPSEYLTITVVPGLGFQVILFPTGLDALSVHIVENGQVLVILQN